MPGLRYPDQGLHRAFEFCPLRVVVLHIQPFQGGGAVVPVSDGYRGVHLVQGGLGRALRGDDVLGQPVLGGLQCNFVSIRD